MHGYIYHTWMVYDSCMGLKKARTFQTGKRRLAISMGLFDRGAKLGYGISEQREFSHQMAHDPPVGRPLVRQAGGGRQTGGWLSGLR